MINIFKNIVSSDYFMRLTSIKKGQEVSHWRVCQKMIWITLPRLINSQIQEIEAEGGESVDLITIKKI